jgi:putative ABC transport system permease protein
MNAIGEWFRRVWYLVNRRRLDDELRRDMEAHRAMMGNPQRFGNTLRLREQSRDVWGWSWLDDLGQDLRYAVRTLIAHKAFSITAVATLALGIGATTAIFSVAYAALFKPLPYHEPDALVAISSYLRPDFPSMPVRAIDFLEYRRLNSVFQGMSALTPADFNLTGAGEPERVYGARVSANFFSLIGVQAHRGRTFLPEEDEPGRDRVVVISHRLWETRFGSDPNIERRAVDLDGERYAIVGIMPRDFLFPTGKQLHAQVPFGPRIDIWKPMAFSRSELTSEGSWQWGVVARLKAGTPIEAAQQDLDTIARMTIVPRVLKQIPASGFTLRTNVLPIRDVFSVSVRQGLLVLLTAVGLLLVITCVNLASLLLARMNSRTREFATRLALGASRARLVRQILTEAAAIGAVGGGIGLWLAALGTPLVAAVGPADLRMIEASVAAGPVLLFTVILALMTAMAFGLVPALSAGGREPRLHLGSAGSRTTSAPHDIRFRRALMTVEVALCAALLAVAGVLLHSFVNVARVDTGFAVDRLLAADVALPANGYSTGGRVAFYDELVRRTRVLPGVASAGATDVLPLLNESRYTQVYLESDTENSLSQPASLFQIVTAGYFATAGIPLMAGRFLDEAERTPVVVVSEQLARTLWPDEPASAAVERWVRQSHVNAPLEMIVGVVGDVRSGGLEREPFPIIYRPHDRFPSTDMTLLVRTVGDPATVGDMIRGEVAKLDDDVPMTSMRTMRDVVSGSMASRRFELTLILLFGALALALAVIGIYGVVSYSVGRQSQEIGVRLALGAQRSEVLLAVLFSALRPIGAGLAGGLAFGVLVIFFIQRMLFGVEPVDPLTLGGVAMVLLTAGTLACYVPARRASRIDPLDALRCD